MKDLAHEVPHDGARGEYQRATGRHCRRPAHVHAGVSAEGFDPLITRIFAAELDRFGDVERPFHMIDFDIRLTPSGSGGQPVVHLGGSQ